MKILNLYAGIGGNRKLWGDEHEITAVEFNPKIAEIYKDLYPSDNMIVGDAHQYLLEHYQEFDFIWSSPPCQSHSRMAKFTRHENKKFPNMDLYEEILFLQHFYSGYWVVENVKPYYEPLVKVNAIIGRHLFWSNMNLNIPVKIEQPKDFINKSTLQARSEMMDWLGIHFDKVIYYGGNHCPVQVLRNCVHPLIGDAILNKVLEIEEYNSIKQGVLF